MEQEEINTLEARRQLIRDARMEGYLMAIEDFELAVSQGYQAPALLLRSRYALWEDVRVPR
jgi:hypothetical protein